MGLSGWVATVKRHGWEVFGTKVPKNRAVRNRFLLTNGSGGHFLYNGNVFDVGKGEAEWVGGCD